MHNKTLSFESYQLDNTSAQSFRKCHGCNKCFWRPDDKERGVWFMSFHCPHGLSSVVLILLSLDVQMAGPLPLKQENPQKYPAIKSSASFAFVDGILYSVGISSILITTTFGLILFNFSLCRCSLYLLCLIILQALP